MTVEVRPALLQDAGGIAEVHVAAWSETYSHLIPAEALARQNVEQRTLRWAEKISGAASANLRAWVAVDGRVIIGFATSSSGHLPDEPRDLELPTIYVLASHHGGGAGQHLLDAALGDAPAFLWVADDNPRAHAFYARNGFVADGTTKVGPVAGTPVLEIRLVR